ncbi:NAD(P)-binding protein [Penicillium angulare]|uniref:NAD(P)-binding protein n=1 Tax=Penicillium angulare TaxID=116970 RepID=UPI0025424069|nr:NAD(P)-binding protein [Penicillium angulare]KAJ5291767.1 NAD(P)-binding protein [Penicillium angulare]
MFQYPIKEWLPTIPIYAAILALTILIYFSKLVHFYSNSHKNQLLNASQELAVVTGGSGIIGSKIILSLQKKGIKTINLDITPPSPSLSESQSQSQSQSPSYFYKTDLSNPPSIASTVSKIEKEHGPPTILINNAALVNPTPIINSTTTTNTTSKVHKIFNTNIISHFYLLEAFMPDMLSNNHGHIVTVSSMVAFMGGALNVDYACTKAGLLALHEGLRDEIKILYGKDGVQATIVHPTWVRTPVTQEWVGKGFLPNKKIIEPEEVADAIVGQIMSGIGGQIILPSDFAGLVLPFVRGLPCWIQEKIRDRAAKTLLKCTEGK